jgi:transcriptional regulator with PAS, ATPase and Fis domain
MENFFAETRFAVTVCDMDATIVYMNDRACQVFEKYGGRDLIGKSLFECHKEHSCAMIKKFLETGTTNAYTIDKGGVKKLIHQSPWYKDGKIAGLVELSIEIPAEMPNFV